MKKGHYGHYTGNARHSRKEEMIHDREMIYDAKTQIHNEDEKYKHTGKSGYKQDMIHERELIHDTKTQLHHADSDYKGDSPAHLSYSSRFGGMTLTDPVSTGAYANFDGGAAGDVSAMRQKARSLDNLQKSISDTVGNYYDKKPAGKKETSVETSVPSVSAVPSVSDIAVSVPKANLGRDLNKREKTHTFVKENPRPKQDYIKYSDLPAEIRDQARADNKASGRGDYASQNYIKSGGKKGDNLSMINLNKGESREDAIKRRLFGG